MWKIYFLLWFSTILFTIFFEITECSRYNSIKDYYKPAAIVIPVTTTSASKTTVKAINATTIKTTRESTTKPTTIKASTSKATNASTTKATITNRTSTTRRRISTTRRSTTAKGSTLAIDARLGLRNGGNYYYYYYDYGTYGGGNNNNYYYYYDYYGNNNYGNNYNYYDYGYNYYDYGYNYYDYGYNYYDYGYNNYNYYDYGTYNYGGNYDYYSYYNYPQYDYGYAYPDYNYDYYGNGYGDTQYYYYYYGDYGTYTYGNGYGGTGYGNNYYYYGGDPGYSYYYYYYQGKRRKRQTTACGCYAPAQCNNAGNTDGTGLIDFRVMSVGAPTCSTGLSYCCPNSQSSQVSCGSRITNYINTPLQSGQAKYGDYPWMALIQTTGGDYVAGGVLIDYQYVLTVAHRISSYSGGSTLKIRLGEWDTSANYEQYPYREYNIDRIWIHESFNPSNLKNDIALIRVTTPVATFPSVGVVPICMPSDAQSFEGLRCWVSGWGKDVFGTTGRYQSVLRATDVPVISSTACQNSLRSTRLGSAFLLDKSSFLCAGGETEKDACTGDGGSGLVCEVSTGKWVLAGLVAWGIGCASQNVPAAYVNIASYVSWIQSKKQN